MKQIPNIITCCRIIGAVGLLFVAPDNAWFWALYAFCGITDILDGFLARKLNAVSKVGSFLDSVADLLFVAVCCWKIIPILTLPSWLWWWIAAIALIKLVNIVSSLIVYRRVVFPHTIANKVTGFLLFVLIPVISEMIPAMVPAIVLASVATFAAVEEGHLIRTKKVA